MQKPSALVWPSSGQIESLLIANPISAAPIDNPQGVVAYVATGMTAAVTGSNGATSPVRLFEGFAAAWKTRNISSTVGNNIPGNATLQGNAWAYNGGPITGGRCAERAWD